VALLLRLKKGAGAWEQPSKGCENYVSIKPFWFSSCHVHSKRLSHETKLAETALKDRLLKQRQSG